MWIKFKPRLYFHKNTWKTMGADQIPHTVVLRIGIWQKREESSRFACGAPSVGAGWLDLGLQPGAQPCIPKARPGVAPA